MNKIKYGLDLIKIMSLFESATGAKLKDAIDGESLIFVVHESDMGKAIGKNGSNVRNLERMLNKKIKIVEFANDAAQFARNLAAPLQLKNAEEKDGILSLYCSDTKTRALIIGRDRKNISLLAEIIKRYFDVKDVKVL